MAADDLRRQIDELLAELGISNMFRVESDDSCTRLVRVADEVSRWRRGRCYGAQTGRRLDGLITIAGQSAGIVAP